MPNAKKLPSGNYRVLVYSHKENGKRKYESFTAPTKKEAELKAAQWKNKKDRRSRSDLTVREAIKGYIDAKEGVLSPSTIRGYRRQLKNNYELIGNNPIQKLTSEDLQKFVSALSKDASPKTVSNIYGLLSSALSLYLPDTAFKVTLPKKVRKRTSAPSDDDIKRLYGSASKELKKCITLAAFGSLRRGEISALIYSDLKGDILTVDKDMIEDDNNNWIIKNMPKTDTSVREVKLPQKVVKLLGKGKPNEKIVKYANPSSISKCFIKLRDKIGVDIRFHDLRHYYASIGVILGCSDIFLAETGGWVHGSNSVMKKVYQNSMEDKSKEYSDKMTSHFNGLL